LVKRLIPDAGGKVLLDIYLLPICDFSNLPLLFLNLFTSLFVRNFVNFVYEHENAGVLVELFDASERHLEVLKNLLVFVPVILNLEYIDKHLNSSKNCLLLHEKVLLHKSVLPPAIPQIES
jgi:hypothetical protein